MLAVEASASYFVKRYIFLLGFVASMLLVPNERYLFTWALLNMEFRLQTVSSRRLGSNEV